MSTVSPSAKWANTAFFLRFPEKLKRCACFLLLCKCGCGDGDASYVASGQPEKATARTFWSLLPTPDTSSANFLTSPVRPAGRIRFWGLLIFTGTISFLMFVLLSYSWSGSSLVLFALVCEALCCLHPDCTRSYWRHAGYSSPSKDRAQARCTGITVS